MSDPPQHPGSARLRAAAALLLAALLAALAALPATAAPAGGDAPPPSAPPAFRADPRPAIGVIVSLSGRFGSAGAYVLDGIKAAAGRETAGRPPVRLEVRDDGGDPARAVAALEELARDPGVVAVLGPLLSNVAPDVTRRAEELGVPIVSLSQKEDLASAGPHVFSNSLSSADQVRALADWAFGAGGLSRFALLYPATAMGGEMTGLMRAAVLERGGSIAAIASYGPEETDLRGAVKRLLGSGYRGAKVGPGDRVLAHLPGIVPPQLDGGVKVLAPGVDFDAVFVPDGYKRVSLVGPALVHEEVDIGDTYGRDKPDVKLLTVAAAHHGDLVRRGGSYLEGAVVVDALHLEDDGEPTQHFLAAFAAQADRPPGLLEAIAWDSARAVMAAIDAAGASREGVTGALSHLPGFQGVTGMTGFGPGREATRRLYVLAATRDGFKKLAP